MSGSVSVATPTVIRHVTEVINKDNNTTLVGMVITVLGGSPTRLESTIHIYVTNAPGREGKTVLLRSFGTWDGEGASSYFDHNREQLMDDAIKSLQQQPYFLDGKQVTVTSEHDTTHHAHEK